MKLHKFGNYDEYKSVQSAKNARQLDVVWATEETMDAVAKDVKTHIRNAKFAIVHGGKAGWEVNALSNRLGIDVIGTDISHTANQFEKMIEWDFHKVKDEWLGNVDFIYTNCLDHSYDPEIAFKSWMSCIQPNGRCYIEWSELHGEDHSTVDDPFGATEEEYHELFSRECVVLDKLIVPADPSHPYPHDRKVFVVGHR